MAFLFTKWHNYSIIILKILTLKEGCSMSLIPHDDLKEILASMNIDFKYIDKMIERSHSFKNTLKNDSIEYTFPLYTSCKRIVDKFNILEFIPEQYTDKIKPLSLHMTFSKIFKVRKVKMTYRYFEKIYILLLDYNVLTGNAVIIDKMKHKHLVNASLSLDKLHSNFNMDKNVCEMIKLNQFQNREYGYFNVADSDNKLSITSTTPNEASFIPKEVIEILGKVPTLTSFEFDENYKCYKVVFTCKNFDAVKSENIYVSTDLDGQLISYGEEVRSQQIKIKNLVNNIEQSNILSLFEFKTEGMNMDEIKTLIKIYQTPDSFKSVVPEYFIEGPSNIPNFSERFTLAKMIAI